VLAHVVLLTACAGLLVVSATQAVLLARRGELNGVRAWMVGMLALSATFTATGQIITLYE
jgi:heme/copper-type cytochrome/quinol oxidase subunit 3